MRRQQRCPQMGGIRVPDEHSYCQGRSVPSMHARDCKSRTMSHIHAIEETCGREALALALFKNSTARTECAGSNHHPHEPESGYTREYRRRVRRARKQVGDNATTSVAVTDLLPCLSLCSGAHTAPGSTASTRQRWSKVLTSSRYLRPSPPCWILWIAWIPESQLPLPHATDARNTSFMSFVGATASGSSCILYRLCGITCRLGARSIM